MSIFRKYCRKPGLPLQQFFNRMVEKDIYGTNDNCDIDSSIQVSDVQHNRIGEYPQYRKIRFKGMLLSTDMRDNCCLLRDGSVCIISEITMESNLYFLTVKRFLEIEEFYDVGISSSSLQVYKCSTLSHEIVRVHFNEVRAKCYRIPLWTSTSIAATSSDEENYPETLEYIILPIIHSEKV